MKNVLPEVTSEENFTSNTGVETKLGSTSKQKGITEKLIAKS